MEHIDSQTGCKPTTRPPPASLESLEYARKEYLDRNTAPGHVCCRKLHQPYGKPNVKRKLVLFLWIIALTSCTPKGEGPSILSNQVCGKSCWNKITIGKTERQEFIQNISALPNVAQASIQVQADSPGSMFDETIIFQYYRAVGDQDTLVRISARTKNQKIVMMTFQGDLGLTFEELAVTFGEPEYVSSHWTFDGGINVHFINSAHGFEVVSYFSSERRGVSPETAIKLLTLFDPTLYQEFMRANILTPSNEFI